MYDSQGSDPILSFVLDASRPHRDGKLEAPPFLNDEDSWREALELLTRLRCLSHALVLVNRAPWFEQIPAGTRLRMIERLEREKITQAVLDGELDRALFAFFTGRIRFAVFGEVELARRFYPDRFLRSLSGVDLLVHPDDFPSAMRALGKADYRQQGGAGRTGVSLVRHPGSPPVRVHSRILARHSDLEVASILSRAEEGRISALPPHAMTLHVDDQLKFLIERGALEHLLESPVWLNDAHYLLEHPTFAEKVDWDRVVWDLAQRRSLSAAWFALHFLAAEWGTRVPLPVLEGMASRVGVVRRSLLSRLATSEAWFPVRGRSFSWSVRSRILLRERTRDAVSDTLRFGLQSSAPY